MEEGEVQGVHPLLKEQTLQHVLNMCPYALNMRRYNHRHDAVLEVIYQFLTSHLPPQLHSTADLPNVAYSFPMDITPTDSRPDMVIWDDTDTVFLIEPTVPFDTNVEEAKRRKEDKYENLWQECAQKKKNTSLITVEVGSRGFLEPETLRHLYEICNRRIEAGIKRKFEEDLCKAAIKGSYEVWCKRNWRDPN